MQRYHLTNTIFIRNIEKNDATTEIEVFVSNLEEDLELDAKDGTMENPVVDISNAITKGFEKAAEFKEATINIYLFKGNHYALWDYDRYQPTKIDRNSNKEQIIIR